MARIGVLQAGLAFTAVLALGGLALSGGASGGSTVCTPGVKTINGTQVRVFCGPAKATVRVQIGTKAAKTYSFKNGQCDRYPKYFDVNIGFASLGAKTKLPYFGLLMGKSPAATTRDPVVARDGTYKGGLITIHGSDGKSYSLFGPEQLTITLKKNRRAGTFVGGTPGSKLYKQAASKISGSFSC
jgi:hypothetical protein